MGTAQAVREAYLAACHAEIDALKPGNVHRFADGHGMTVQQFLRSAAVSAPWISDPALRVGPRILGAVEATRRAVGTNTNLGILLLCAPLAVAAEAGGDVRSAVANVLEGMDGEDARAVFSAIALAEPGGLGEAPNDLRRPPVVPLLDAVREAAGRDRIALQYATGFSDVFATGLAALDASAAAGEAGMWPTIACYMAFLSRFADSHVERRHGVDIAESVRARADLVRQEIAKTADVDARIAVLTAFDAELKREKLNPGTSADLTVAALFVRQLRASLHNHGVGA